jgi:hypothetical protein
MAPSFFKVILPTCLSDTKRDGHLMCTWLAAPGILSSYLTTKANQHRCPNSDGGCTVFRRRSTAKPWELRLKSEAPENS